MSDNNLELTIDYILDYIYLVNVPCTDDGKKFINNQRVKRIEMLFKHSDYLLTKKASLSRIYEHKNLDRQKRIIVVSCHIDSVYDSCWMQEDNQNINGTFDNSACVGILSYLMENNKLPHNVIVAFTGNEEQDGKGAKQVSKYLKKEYKECDIKYVISLDLTNDAYGKAHYTFENLTIDENNIAEHILELLSEARIIEDAAPDDSWTYKKYGFSCFSLCLPCENIGEDMHSSLGVRIKQDSLVVFSNTLQDITNYMLY